ncbi:MAG TPA: ABC transporter permease [Gemmatimonadaceae bacterium]|jgi:predicted permease
MLTELWSDLRYRLRALLQRDAVERELDDELRFHLEREADKHIARGAAPNEARRRARLAFGGVENARERTREAHGTARVEWLIQDVRYGVRSLRQHRVFTLSVVATLALGIGANTAIFTLVDALLLRRLPVPQADQLVTIGDPAAVNQRWTGSPETDYVSYPLYVDVRDHNGVLSGLYANGSPGDVDAIIGADLAGPPEHPVVRLVSENFFDVLELRPLAGRTFSAADESISKPNPVAVLSYAYWERRFNRDHSAVGAVIRMNGVPVTVIGIMPAAFWGDIVGQPTDLWIPLSMQPALQPRVNRLNDRASSWLVLMGRLAPNVTLERARTVLPMLEAQAVRAHVSGIERSRFEEELKANPIRVERGGRGFSEHREIYGSALVVLLAAVALVILVVCANVSNLMLARAVARTREMTVRLTLGAGRGRLVQQILVESLLLAVTAGVFGSLAAVWGSQLLLAHVRGDPPVVLDVLPNASVLAFTAGSTLACVLLFGVAPAIRLARLDLATVLRGGGRGLTGAAARAGRMPVARLLVVGQIALSTVLLIGSGLLVRSMRQLLATDLGMDRDHVIMAHVATSRTNYTGARLNALEQAMRARILELHGVDAASYSAGGPFSGGHSSGHVTVSGFLARADSEGEVDIDYVGPDYFRALGTRLIRGRDFAVADMSKGAGVAAISATMAKYYFRDRDPIGQSVTLDDETFSVIAVVGDAQYRDVRGKLARRLFVPDLELSDRVRSFEVEVHVRSAIAPSIETVRQTLMGVDRSVPIEEVVPLVDRVRQSVAQDELLTKVTAFFGAIALVLAALGLYGITAYATTQRTGEFGLRAALGAEPWRVAALVLRQAVVVAMAGVALGIPLGLAATRLLSGALFGVHPLDLPSLGLTVTTLGLTTLIASYLPAWKAAKVSPSVALRAE